MLVLGLRLTVRRYYNLHINAFNKIKIRTHIHGYTNCNQMLIITWKTNVPLPCISDKNTEDFLLLRSLYFYANFTYICASYCQVTHVALNTAINAADIGYGSLFKATWMNCVLMSNVLHTLSDAQLHSLPNIHAKDVITNVTDFWKLPLG